MREGRGLGWEMSPLAGLGPSARCWKRCKGVWSTNWGGVGKGGKRAFSLQGPGARGSEPFTYNLLSLLLLPHFSPVLLV